MADPIQDAYEGPRARQSHVVMGVAVFAILALLLNTEVFVGWAREAPFSPEITERLISVADRINTFGNDLGFDTLRNWVRQTVEEIRGG